MTVDEALAAAWTLCAPGRARDVSYPRGFWPDVARVACEMIAQNTHTPTLSFRPTMCSRGDGLQSRSPRSAKKSRAENTARLLKQLEGVKL